MISRRNALKLGAVGLVTSKAAWLHSSTRAMAQGSTYDVPMLGGNPARTGELAGTGPRLDIPIIVKWHTALGNYVDASPVIVGDTVFIYDKGIQALDAETGSKLWYFPTTEFFGGMTPAIADGLLFLGSRSGLHAIDVSSGAERWLLEYDISRQYTAPAVMDGVVYIGNGGNMRAVDAASGAELWTSRFGGGTPAISGGYVYSRDNAGMCAINATDGELIWRLNDTGGSSPAVVDEVVYYGDSGTLHAVDGPTNTLLWSNFIGGTVLNPTVTGGTIYVSNNITGLYALDAATGSEQWFLELPSYIGAGSFTSFADGLLYFSYGDGNGTIYAVDADTSELHWAYECGAPINGAPIASDSTVYLANEEGNVFAISNLPPAVLANDAVVYSSPSNHSVERGTLTAGTEFQDVATREHRQGEDWVEVTTGDVTGWILLAAFDPETLPENGEFEYVYIPDHLDELPESTPKT